MIIKRKEKKNERKKRYDMKSVYHNKAKGFYFEKKTN